MPISIKSRRKNLRNFFSFFAALGALALPQLSRPAYAKKTFILNSAFVPAAKPSTRRIRIGVAVGADEVHLACRGRCTFTDATGKLYYLVSHKSYVVRAMKNGIDLKLGGLEIGPKTTVKTERMTDCALINGRCYRGMLILRHNGDDTVTAVDVLDIEDYLMGVLPNEMDGAWPLEALKAQAVVARTFAYTQLDKYEAEGYDLSDDTRSQVFGDLAEVPLSVRRAVNETAGEVLGYKGKILDVYYTSCCGGHTADEATVWGGPEPPPPLRGVRDPYCKRSPFFKWKVYVPLSEVMQAVQPGNILAGPLEYFRIGRKNWDGYVQDFLADIGGDDVTVSGSQLRRRIGAATLRSARIFRVRLLSGQVEFEGHGFGHGVGLCQWGAREQAKIGRDYKTILKFYFPGSYLALVDE